MARPKLELDQVTFAYPGAAEAVLAGITLRFNAGWTALVGANGAGKTTLLRLLDGALAPTAGQVRRPDVVAAVPQRTDGAPAALADFVVAFDAEACRWRGRLGIGDDWPDRWDTLSHGERKRAQLACVLWRRPDALFVDEPTNHLDAAARRLVRDALAGFSGFGVIVSHDRALLDTLCRHTVFVASGRLDARSGSFSEASAQRDAERLHAVRERERAAQALRQLRRTWTARSEAAARADKQRSKRGIAARDHDAKSRIDAARVSGKDGQAGRLKSQMEGRLRQSSDRLDAHHVQKEARLGVSIEGTSARRDVLVRLAAQRIPLGEDSALDVPECIIRRDDRIGLTGANGAGKSTLLRRLLEVAELPADRLLTIPQEITAAEARRVVGGLRDMPHDRLGEVLTIVSCLGSDPERVLATDEPSPGETRKLSLALGMAASPWLIVLDEPTNHLDLPSIECLECALAACPSALLLVSHDTRLLERLTATTWWIEDGRLRVGAGPD